MAGELTEELAKGLPRAGCGKWLGSNGQFTSNKPLMIASGHDRVFSKEGNLRLVELLMGGPGLTLSAKLVSLTQSSPKHHLTLTSP